MYLSVQVSSEYVPVGVANSKSWMIRAMVWCRLDDKPLLQSVLTNIYGDASRVHLAKGCASKIEKKNNYLRNGNSIPGRKMNG